MKKEQWFKLIYLILRPVGYVFFPQKTVGRENLPEGPAVICANHSQAIDPILVAFSMGRKQYLRIMAKAELRKVPVVGWVLHKAGIIYVKRGERDIDSVKASLRALKAGEKLMLFPEGTRVREGETVAAKSGAVHMASRANVPVVPVFIPRNKKIFRKSRIIIGEPYRILVENRADVDSLAEDMMARIWALGEKNHE